MKGAKEESPGDSPFYLTIKKNALACYLQQLMLQTLSDFFALHHTYNNGALHQTVVFGFVEMRY
jgi:hypothetical protein